MRKNNSAERREKWCMSWDWHPRDWSTFGWYKMRYDTVIIWALNLGPLSIYNDWVPILKTEG